ncbi:CGEA protein [Bacillus sp. AFS023182]|uniref:CGEA protein n=1 Tax=Bacillus sp. AFS023182 TaxID=2033492 RepID=UPI001596B884|nr:CGEA protein [Bacillus sp. AFS023182]
MACESSICRLFSNMSQGAIITVVGKSGYVYGPAKFTSFNKNTCIVILEEQDLPSPSFTTTILISCDDIESIIVIND